MCVCVQIARRRPKHALKCTLFGIISHIQLRNYIGDTPILYVYVNMWEPSYLYVIFWKEHVVKNGKNLP